MTTSTADPKPAPRGIRNNNPGNLRFGEPWNGCVGEDRHGMDLSDRRPGYCIFLTPVLGIRAIAHTLDTYYTRYELKTVKSILERYAPPEDENDTPAYVDDVCKRLGVKPDAEVNPKDLQTRTALVEAIIAHECDNWVYDPETVRLGVTAA